jgi:hypothetical protein
MCGYTSTVDSYFLFQIQLLQSYQVCTPVLLACKINQGTLKPGACVPASSQFGENTVQ